MELVNRLNNAVSQVGYSQIRTKLREHLGKEVGLTKEEKMEYFGIIKALSLDRLLKRMSAPKSDVGEWKYECLGFVYQLKSNAVAFKVVDEDFGIQAVKDQITGFEDTISFPQAKFDAGTKAAVIRDAFIAYLKQHPDTALYGKSFPKSSQKMTLDGKPVSLASAEYNTAVSGDATFGSYAKLFLGDFGFVQTNTIKGDDFNVDIYRDVYSNMVELHYYEDDSVMVYFRKAGSAELTFGSELYGMDDIHNCTESLPGDNKMGTLAERVAALVNEVRAEDVLDIEDIKDNIDAIASQKVPGLDADTQGQWVVKAEKLPKAKIVALMKTLEPKKDDVSKWKWHYLNWLQKLNK